VKRNAKERQRMNSSKRVLLVDDLANVRRVVKGILKQIGFTEITEADDGSTALAELKKRKVDLIISDWNMPKVSGLELLKAVRSDESMKDTPFLMVTVEALKDNVLEAVQAGVTNYIVKPFTAEDIKEKLEQIFKE
jgi:two-component system chemotaxis response regulator CheY